MLLFEAVCPVREKHVTSNISPLNSRYHADYNNSQCISRNTTMNHGVIQQDYAVMGLGMQAF